MIRAQDLKGVMAMMPAFTTPSGFSLNETDTVDTAALETAVDKIIHDGINVIAAMGSFGEFHTLLLDEKKKLAEVTIAVTRKRVPVFIGCSSTNPRETMSLVKFAEKAGADGVLCAVPFYFPSTVENAVRFYLDLADAFPRLAIAVYHNPPLHRATIPVAAFEKLVTRPNIVAMKDSHRSPAAFMQLMDIVKDKISVFCNQMQTYPYMMLGAAGFWSISAWMGPWPLLRMRDACFAGDWETAKEICLEMNRRYKTPGRPGDLFWRENVHKLEINEAGYCVAGPLRPPFREIPQEIFEHARKQAEEWKKLCAMYSAGKAHG